LWQHSSVSIGDCEPFHHEAVDAGNAEFRVFRCSWGWCVKRGDAAFRARMLLDAFEEAYGGPLERQLLRDVVGTIERALNAEHARRGETVSTVVSPPAHP
jgi:hypothetical protein